MWDELAFTRAPQGQLPARRRHFPPWTSSSPTEALLTLHGLKPLWHRAFSYCSWGSLGKNTEVVCHSLLQWTIFHQQADPTSPS